MKVFGFLSSTKAIGTRLSELCHSESESPANILGYIYDEDTKRRMRKEDEEEDYLDDSESKHHLPNDYVVGFKFCFLIFEYKLLTLLFNFSFRHSQSNQMWLPLCFEDGCLSAPPRNHHFLERDFSLPTTSANRASCGQKCNL